MVLLLEITNFQRRQVAQFFYILQFPLFESMSVVYYSFKMKHATLLQKEDITFFEGSLCTLQVLALVH